MSALITRRALVGGMAAGVATLLSGCDRLTANEDFRKILFSADNMHRWTQRALINREALAREYSPADMSPRFRANGTRYPQTPFYLDMSSDLFARWQVKVWGLVNRPLTLSMPQIRAMPQREQITRHDCVEGWSAIGKWRGVPLKLILEQAGLRDTARYIVFHCADDMGGGKVYYESCDLVDAFHPQTILAWAMNDKPLQVAHGAPVRMRIERQLGYKQPKYVTGIEAVSSLRGINGGKGGFWEDVAGYEWYGGL